MLITITLEAVKALGRAVDFIDEAVETGSLVEITRDRRGLPRPHRSASRA